MLRDRVLTAMVLIPVVLWTILWPDPRGFALLMGLIVVLGAYEWGRLVGMPKLLNVVYSACTCIFILLLFYIDQFLVYQTVIAVAVVFWCLATATVVAYQYEKHLLNRSRVLLLIIGQLLLLATWASLFFIKSYFYEGRWLLLWLMLIIWSADTGAYFVGKKMGKHRLASRVSPGKTWEGTIAGVCSGIIIGFAYVIVFSHEMNHYLIIMLTTVLTVIFSIVGDLFESIIKRDANMKDSGQLLPGHGGVLDRIDSLTAAAPVFALACILSGGLL